MTLTEQVAFVTGASQGIGRACALLLAEAGAKVAAASRNLEQLRSLAGRHPNEPCRAFRPRPAVPTPCGSAMTRVIRSYRLRRAVGHGEVCVMTGSPLRHLSHVIGV